MGWTPFRTYLLQVDLGAAAGGAAALQDRSGVLGSPIAARHRRLPTVEPHSAQDEYRYAGNGHNDAPSTAAAPKLLQFRSQARHERIVFLASPFPK